MRAIYETRLDRAAELQVAQWLAAREGKTARPAPRLAPFDFILIDRHGLISDWIEIKCRTNPVNQYATYMVSMGKYRGLVDLRQRTGMATRLVVKWTDAIGALSIPAQNVKSGHGGRYDRGDPKDRETVARIPIRQFVILARRK